jgi:DNA-binding transcriptional ArsR family regulator
LNNRFAAQILSFQFLFTKIFKPLSALLNWQGVALTEENQYDEIFTALKHPVRRQILLFIDGKGEASFTEIQQQTGITDTGLMSYHLKGLASLVEQSKRGKYQLSEVGQAGITLLRKADHEKERTSIVIHQEIERFIGLSIKKSVLFLLIAGLTTQIPLLIDIYFHTNTLLNFGTTTSELALTFFGTLLVMVAGVFLFTVYDRHYYAKNTIDSIIHSTLFTLGCSVVSIVFFKMMNDFSSGSILVEKLHTIGIPWMFEVFRVTIFMASGPVIAFWLSNRFPKQIRVK